MSAKPAWRQRCRAKNRKGARCSRWALAGAFVCKLHGAASPKARKAAAVRLLELFHAGADVVESELPQLDPHSRAQLGVAAMRIALAAGVVPGTAAGPRVESTDATASAAAELAFATDAELDALGAIYASVAARQAAGILPERSGPKLLAAPAALPAASLPPIDVEATSAGDEAPR